MNTISSNTTSSKQTDSFHKKRDAIMTSLETAFIMFLLKQLSTPTQPLSASQIAFLMSFISGKQHSEKTILQRLQHLCTLQEDENESVIANTLQLTFGGHIVKVTNNKKEIVKPQNKFYFAPLLDKSDLELICGAITSNRYLSSSEKEYLLSREMTFGSLNDDKDAFMLQMKKQEFSFPDFKQKKEKKKNNSMPSFLHNVNQLYDAIQNHHMVSLVYGIYDSDGRSRLQFHAKNADKPYKLNPYAMLWNNGAFYLLATHKGHDNPVHFRIDRIVSVQPLRTEEDYTKFQSSAPIPDTLKQFFHSPQNKQCEFLVENYTATYPLMGIYDNTNYQQCLIECTPATLSILIDTFGTNISIYPSTIPHDATELDFHGKPKTFLMAKIKHVQYDNILQFCLQQHTSITAIAPSQLVEDIQQHLLDSFNRYKKYQSIT